MSLIWPYPTKDPSQFRRIDQGWDLQVPVGTPVLAVASGTITYGHNASGFGDPYPVLLLDEPIDGNHGVYYGHNHPEVAAGAHVNQGDVIAHALAVPGGNAHGLPGWLEIGWWNTGPTGDGQSVHDHLLAAPVLGAPPQGDDIDMAAKEDIIAALVAHEDGIKNFLTAHDDDIKNYLDKRLSEMEQRIEAAVKAGKPGA